MASSSDYVATLRELEQMHNNGVIDDAAYEVHKAKIIQESLEPTWTPWRALTIFVICLVLAIAIIRFINLH